MPSVEKEGFEIIPDLFDQKSMTSVIDLLEGMPLRRGRAGVRNALQIDSVRGLAVDPRLLTIASKVLGTGAVPFRATLFDKSFRANWLVVWHQDTALPLRERHDARGWGPWSVKEGVLCGHAPAYALKQVLAIRIHLDHSNQQNGSLRVLPQTHMLGVLSDDAIYDLANRIPAMDCHVPAGGVLLMRPLLVHASSKAKSETAHRRVLHIEYAARLSFADGLELCTPETQPTVQASQLSMYNHTRR